MSVSVKAVFTGRWFNRPKSIEAGNGVTFTDTDDKQYVISQTQFGYLAKSVAGTGTTALTAAERDHKVIEFTGALTGNMVATFPAFVAGQKWTFFNNTTGAHTLTVKGPSGSGLAITQDKKVDAYDSGADIFASGSEV